MSIPTYRQRKVLAKAKPAVTVVGKETGGSTREGRGNKRNLWKGENECNTGYPRPERR